MRIPDVEMARAIIAHEAADCFVGEEGKKSRQPAQLVSCTGGVFWGKRGESWPCTEVGEPLMPWLQIVCTEMKGLYGPFYRKQAVCFYLNAEFDGYEATSRHDQADFVVREYGLGDKLRRLQRPEEVAHHAFHRVKWKKTKDYPCLSKYYELFEEPVYESLSKLKRFKYDNRSGIKIGGWPTCIQGDQRYPGEFDLQIDITQNYMYADSGIGYLKRRGTNWYLMFETL